MFNNHIFTSLNSFIKEGKETDNLKKWFGDSKIIDSDTGRPLVCYHGSSYNNISIFDTGRVGSNSGNYGHYGYGIYFSDDLREAEQYGNIIYKCYLRIINPFIGTNKQILELKQNGMDNIDDVINVSIDLESLKEEFKNTPIIHDFICDFEKYNIEKAWDNIHNKSVSNDIKEQLQDITDILDYTSHKPNIWGVPDYIIELLDKYSVRPKFNKDFSFHQSLHWITDLGNRSKEFTDLAKNLGYDGVWYGSEIVAFNSNQIKSADKNDGTYDLNDDNIYS